MNVRTAFPLLLLTLFCVGIPTPTAAANLSGIVQDPSGAAVPGATVSAQNMQTGVDATVRTGPLGAYVFPDLAPGTYRLRVTAPGFQASTQEPIEVHPTTPVKADTVLPIMQASTTIKIDESAETGNLLALSRVRKTDLSGALENSEGYSAQYGGGISSQPVLRGLGDDRVNVLLNGMTIGQACGNHMNPPLAYTTPAAAGMPLVLAGVTPVSLGGDSTGGTIAVDTPAPAFVAPGRGLSAHGGVSMFHRTSGVANGGSAWFSLAGEWASLAYNGSYVNANNYKDGAGRAVMSTFYEAQNHDLQLAAQRGANQFRFGLGYQLIPQQGFANARMDMTRNEAWYVNGGYSRLFQWGKVAAKLYYQHTRHGMNILRDKIPGMHMPMETRGANLGYTVSLERQLASGHTFRVGQEFRRFTLDDWWPATMLMVGSMGPETLWNVRDGRRNRVAVFGEWEARQTRAWTTLLGVRGETVGMNAGDVIGYNTSPTTTGSAAYAADAAEFNTADRSRRDFNVDVTALARYEGRPGSRLEFGFARKTRSPGIYERYLWLKRSSMAMNMNGWFGDGNGYTGNLNLRPEAAYHFTMAAEWRSSGDNPRKIRIAPFYTHFQDFIDVRRCPIIDDRSNGCTPTTFNATSGFTSLQFFNFGARLYGVDGSWRLPLMRTGDPLGGVTLAGMFSIVRGENRDTGDNLYNIMPMNTRVWLEHRRRAWSSAFEFQAIDAKRNVQAVRNELSTPGYALLNVRTGYRWGLSDSAGVRLDAGVDNLANRFYALPLGGRYWVADKTGRTQVPGMGRNVYGGLTFEF